MNDWKTKDASFVWHPYTPDPKPIEPKLFVRGEGAFLFDEDDTPYFDSMGSWWSQLHGHGHPALVEALSRQAKQLDHSALAPHTHPAAIECAEQLVTMLGPPFKKVFFSDDGSTAVEAALKMALQYFHNIGDRKRRRFVSLTEGYHGDTLGSVSVGYIESFHHFFEKVIPKGFQVTQPYCYRCPVNKHYPACDIACLESATQLFKEKGDEIAALVVEPLVMGAAGMVVYPPVYLEGLVRLAREAGALVIFDEVLTGFGRTGSVFAFEQIELRPDIVALSKGLTSGMMPLGATVATDAIYDAFKGSPEKQFFHGHTFSGHAIGCAVATKSMQLLDLEKNAPLIEIMKANVENFSQLRHVGEVRQLGMLWAAELVMDKKTKSEPVPANGPGWKLSERLWKQGIWNRPLHNIVYTVPPYCTSEKELKNFFDVLYEELKHATLFS